MLIKVDWMPKTIRLEPRTIYSRICKTRRTRCLRWTRTSRHGSEARAASRSFRNIKRAAGKDCPRSPRCHRKAILKTTQCPLWVNCRHTGGPLYVSLVPKADANRCN